MFHKCSTPAEAKKVFRRLALRLHPDAGGEADLMILLQEAYELVIDLMKEIEHSKLHEEKKRCYTETPLKYETAYEDVYDDDERLDILDEILRYGGAHPKFDTSKTESIQEYLLGKGYITSAQFNALVRVYYAFRMDKGTTK